MSRTAEFIDRSTDAYRRALTEQLGDRDDVDVTTDPEVAGRRAAATVTAGQAWAGLVGPFTDSAGAAAALGGITKQAVSQRVAAGSVLGLRLASGGTARDRLVYPAWQFHTTVLAHLPTVLAAAGFDPDRPVTGWTIAAWLTTPDDSLGGMTPQQLLRAGHREPVLQVAAAVAESLGTTERRTLGAPSAAA
jgi:hypothetical protein